MKLIKKCTEPGFALLSTRHAYTKWKQIGVEERIEGEYSILGAQITWQGFIAKLQRKCKDCGERFFGYKKM